MSQQTENARLGSVADFTADNYEDKKFFFVLSKSNTASSYSDNKSKIPTKVYPSSYGHILECQVYWVDPKTQKGKNRIARYIPGEASIWKDEQSPDKDVPKIKQVLEFIEGYRRVDGSLEKELLQYLMVDPANASTPNRPTNHLPVFKLVDMQQELTNEMKKELDAFEAVNWCFKGEIDKVLAYARTMNISMDRDPDEIRYRMSQYAKLNVGIFLDGMNNPQVLRKHYVLEAISRGILEKNAAMNALLWRGGGVLIESPRGVDPVDFFVDHSATPNGEGAYQTVLSHLGKGSTVKEAKTGPAPVPAYHGKNVEAPKQNHLPGLETSGVTYAEVEKLVDEAVAKGTIVNYGKSTWAFDVVLNDKKKRVSGGPNQRAFAGKNNLLDALKEEPKFYEMVQNSLN